MLASLPCDYPRTKKRSFVAETDPFNWTKRTKHNHQPSSFGSFSPASLVSPRQFVQPKSIHDKTSTQTLSSLPLGTTTLDDSLEEDPMDEIMMDSSTRSLFSERIDDMETYLNENVDKKDKGLAGQAIDIYSLLHQQRSIKATMINGVLLPMEQKQGETKYSIPEFVLRSSTGKPPAMLMPTTNQNHNAMMDYDPMAMDID